MVQVKVCGITNLEDALAALAAGADALGFNFYRRSSRYIAPDDARRIIAELPSSVLCVGVFVNEESAGMVARMARESGVAAVQLHGDETPEYCAALPGGLEVIKALRTGQDFAPEDAAAFPVRSILLDAFSEAARGGTGETCDWTLARRTREVVARLYLAGGLTPDNVAGAIAAVEPFAVDVCSGVEVSPGRKDAARVRAFIAAVRACEKNLDAPSHP